MTKDEIVLFLEKEYQKERETAKLASASLEDAKLQLLVTTQEFVKSFDYYLPVERGIIGRIKRFIKRIIRKSIRFITKPYAEQNLKYQEKNSELSGKLIELIEKQEDQINRIKEWSETYQKETEHQIKLIRADMMEKVAFCDNIIQNNQDVKVRIAVLDEFKESFTKSFKDLEMQTKTKIQDVKDEISAVRKTGLNNVEAIYKSSYLLNENTNDILELRGDITQCKDYLFRDVTRSFMSFSQCGEDSIVNFLINYNAHKPTTFNYLDIGCNHYKNLNNTYGFYKQGMSGVLVEANSVFVHEIKEMRPRDVVLNCGVGGVHQEGITFYVSNTDSLSSFDKSSIEKAKIETPWVNILREEKVDVLTMDEIVEKNFINPPTLVSIDVEGLEMEILNSISFDKYRPFVFIIETIEYSKHISINSKRKDIINFMENNGYVEFAFTGFISLFVDFSKVDYSESRA